MLRKERELASSRRAKSYKSKVAHFTTYNPLFIRTKCSAMRILKKKRKLENKRLEKQKKEKKKRRQRQRLENIASDKVALN